MSQRWEDLVMAHYAEDPKVIESSIPDDLLVDTFEGRAWFSVVAFRLTNLRIQPFTFLPWQDFWEINLRTYVLDKVGNRGVWFYSLDSSDLFGVFGARLLYGLRYNFARIYRTGYGSDQKLIYHGQRGNIARSKIAAEWKGAELVSGPPGSLDHFLLERYRFWVRRGFARSSSSAFVRHIPYNACRLRKVGYEGELFSSQGFAEPRNEPVLGHYCPGFSVEATAPEWVFSISGQANHR
jgi:uncharacterized protein YqjF (DUF2071 family)